MAQVKLLKIASDGVPLEHTSSSDQLTMVSFSLDSGAVFSSTGLAMNNTDISAVQDLIFQAPSTGTINQTAGNLVIDNIMAKERGNTLTTAADILFPVIANSAGQVDAFRVPNLPGVPSATPTASGAGFLVYDTSNKDLYAWTGTEWDNLNTVSVASNIDDSYIAEVAIAANDVVYISSDDSVSPADATAAMSAQAVGLATAAALITDPVVVRKIGRLAGFSGLTGGARYYLDPATAGAISATLPVGSGNTIVQVGYAKNATTLDIQIQSLGRRA